MMEMLYETFKAMISLGRTDGLLEKIKRFKKDGKLTEEQCTELISMLG